MSLNVNNNKDIRSSWDNYSFIKKSAVVVVVGSVAGVASYYAASYTPTRPKV